MADRLSFLSTSGNVVYSDNASHIQIQNFQQHFLFNYNMLCIACQKKAGVDLQLNTVEIRQKQYIESSEP